jgi:hypothetical protein
MLKEPSPKIIFLLFIDTGIRVLMFNLVLKSRSFENMPIGGG